MYKLGNSCIKKLIGLVPIACLLSADCNHLPLRDFLRRGGVGNGWVYTGEVPQVVNGIKESFISLGRTSHRFMFQGKRPWSYRILVFFLDDLNSDVTKLLWSFLGPVLWVGLRQILVQDIFFMKIIYFKARRKSIWQHLMYCHTFMHWLLCVKLKHISMPDWQVLPNKARESSFGGKKPVHRRMRIHENMARRAVKYFDFVFSVAQAKPWFCMELFWINSCIPVKVLGICL